MSKYQNVEKVEIEKDSYRLRAEDVREAPRNFKERLRYLGPGLVISAAVVGSGELLVTTSLGARAGFALLWLVIVAAGVKVWVQMELARWAILNGRTALDGYSTVRPKIGPMGWINWLWVGLDIAKTFQRGGVIGATAAACSLLWPVFGESLGQKSVTFWAVIVTLLTIWLVHSAKYSVVETAMTVSVVVFTACTVIIVASLPFTPFAYSVDSLVGGLSFTIPAGTIGLAVAMFGSTGVGADDMTNYTYWCLEKGYARWTGPDDGTEERAVRAYGWIKVMQLDVFVSWLTTTIATLSFYIMGASVLSPQNLVPEGNDVIITISRAYTDTMGSWAEILYLVAAIIVLFSTTIASAAAVPRLWTNSLGLMGLFDWSNVSSRTRVLKIFSVCLPAVWLLVFLFVQSLLLMLVIGGIATAVFLLAVLIAVWKLRSTEVEVRFRGSRWTAGALIVSSGAIVCLAGYTLLDVFGVGL